MAKQTSTGYGVGEARIKLANPVLWLPLDPTTNDVSFDIGQIWINKLTRIAYILVSLAGGVADWQQLTNFGSGFPFVVGPAGLAPYQTIQSAVNAAILAGGGTVIIFAGTYNENLVLADKINLFAFNGELGTTGIFTESGMVSEVIVNGTLTIDTSAQLTSSYNTIYGIRFSPVTGSVVTYNTNAAALSTLAFVDCEIIATQAGTFALVCDGFPTINFYNTTISETVPNATDFFSLPGASPFLELKCVNSSFEINKISPCIVNANADVQMFMKSCIYSSMMDSTTPASSFNFTGMDCTFEWSGVANEPLFNAGAQDCAIEIDSSLYLSGSGPFCVSTSVSSESRINNTYFTNTLNLNSNCIDVYSNCIFNTGSATAIAMNSATNVTLSVCTIDSTAVPVISGTGAGTLNLANITYLKNFAIAGTVTKGYTNRVEFGNLKLNDVDNGVLQATNGVVTVGTVTVPNGGTGDTSLTAHGVLIGEGANAVAVTAAGVAHSVFMGTLATTDPAFTITGTPYVSSISFDAGTNSLAQFIDTTTFTPTIVGSTGAGTATYTEQSGRYMVIGNWVLFNINLAWHTHTGTGDMTIAGFPFKFAAAQSFYPNVCMMQNIALPVNTKWVVIDGVNNAQTAEVTASLDNAAFAQVQMSAAGSLHVQGFYPGVAP